jgi:D-beta-D-heptose 7-phosphate kinase/D-beta-D-heptose 1-phosphate adenosyltransferase
MIRVIGDIILDRWIVGDIFRLSPEAPVPVLAQTSDSYTLGGAANVALNLSKMEMSCKLYGSIGFNDDEAIRVRRLAETIPHALSMSRKVTTTKTRLVTETGRHLLRWDNELRENVDISFDEFDKDDIIIISDYDKGDITEKLVHKYTKTNKVFVDPKQGPDTYKGAFLVKPNMKEFLSWAGIFDLPTVWEMMRLYEWEWLVITDGPNGLHVFNDAKATHNHYMTTAKKVSDVTGAGDVVISAIAAGYENGLTIPIACERANNIATQCIERKGTSVWHHTDT